MIARLTGQLAEKRADRIVLLLGGFGVDVQVPLSTYEHLPETGAEVSLETHLHVREDALQLFGFLTLEEKDFFLRLTAVSGIGPRLALGILSASAVDRLRLAIESEDVTTLSRLPGLGKKTAGKLILELKGKLPEMESAAGGAPSGAVAAEALSALLNLGYRKTQAEAALRSISRDASLEEAITGALKVLAPSRG